MEDNKNIEERFCKKCGLSNNECRFRHNSRICLKCASKINNEKLKLKNYYKNYYVEHREQMIKRGLTHYYDVKTTKVITENKKVGRPKKEIVVNI